VKACLHCGIQLIHYRQQRLNSLHGTVQENSRTALSVEGIWLLQLLDRRACPMDGPAIQINQLLLIGHESLTDIAGSAALERGLEL
jgi:hypothetical protein